MSADLKNYGYGVSWKDFYTDSYEGYRSQMSDYHMHSYYEISLIFSGNVKVLFPDKMQSGEGCRLVLTRPMTPHLILCEPDKLYSRVNMLFSSDYFSTIPSEWKPLLGIFSKGGRVLILTKENATKLGDLAEKIKNDSDPIRRRLRLLLFLSIAAETAGNGEECANELPEFVSGALSYLHEHYSEKIVAETLAWHLGIGRTTLMTAFKKYTGSTINEYLTDLRIKEANKLLQSGYTEQLTAEECGFGDTSSMIRCFKKRFNMTPKQYVKAYHN
ncbi:MAG: helix-turn-helix transcriptional regulator [Clostridia bacterium]|nr:helix-turn-helix transcriptional regulator [Clostridia bacterium]